MNPIRIVPLSDTSQLAHNLPLSSLSVLVFTAVWSIESQHALDALRNASTFTSCRSSIQFYELPWPPSRNILRYRTNSRSRRRRFFYNFPSDFAKLKSLSAKTRFHRDELVYSNMTNTVPWLPCIQLYSNSSEGVVPFIYEDSFDALSIASFLNQACDSITHLSHENGPLMSADLDSCKNPLATPASRDRFAAYVNSEGNSRTCGLLVILRGGTEVLHQHFPTLWTEILKIVHDLNSNTVDRSSEHSLCHWSVTIVNADVDTNFAEKIDFDGSHESMWFIMIDTVRDDVRIVKSTKQDVTSFGARTLLQRILVTQKGITSSHVAVPKSSNVGPKKRNFHWPRNERLLRYFERPMPWRPYLYLPRSHISLKDWMMRRYDRQQVTPSILWMVFHQSWCAHCQRVLGIFRRFADIVHRANVDVHVLFVEDFSRTPSWIDDAVDGFPTIIIIHQLDYWSTMEEYQSSHSIHQLIEFHGSHLSQALWAQNSRTFSKDRTAIIK